jgi:Galactose oxidase, central domain
MSILHRWFGQQKHALVAGKASKGVLALSIALLLLLFLVPSASAQSTAAPPTWFQLAPSGGPPAVRASFDRALAYDQTHNRVIIFGGDTTGGTLLNDTWVLVGADGTSASPQWIQLNTVNTPAPRKAHSIAYDATNNILILYGGCLGLCTPIDTNVFTLSNANGLGGTPTWTQLSTTAGPPPQRDEASAVYDPTSNELIVFGGDNCCGGRYNDTWVLSNANGLGGTPTWTQLSTAGVPPARVGHSAVYDVTNNRMIIFGGYDCCGNPLNDTWVLSNANGLGGTPTWTQLSPSGTLPPVRSNHGAVFDATANKMIIFDGSNSSGFLNDVWVLSHANGLGGAPSWKQAIPVSTAPAARSEAVVYYRSSSHRLIVFGGSNGPTDFNDTWVLLNVR